MEFECNLKRFSSIFDIALKLQKKKHFFDIICFGARRKCCDGEKKCYVGFQS